jgi:hypothetical protein
VLLDEDENDPTNPLEMLPILFTSHKNYDESFASFLESLKTGGDSVETNDIDFEIKRGCIVQQNRAGELLFCEAVKVDASLSDVELKKNVRNMISLLEVLFEDFGEAMTWYEEITENLSVSEQLGADLLYLFNNTNESADLDESLFGQHILDKLPGWKQEVPKLLKSWFLFSYREFYRNLLVLLGKVSERIYGSKTKNPNNLSEVFVL